MIKLRCLILAALSTAGLATVAAWLVPGATVLTHDPAGAVTSMSTVALLAASTWGWVAIQAGVVDAWRRSSGDGGPAAAHSAGGVRRWVLAVCGVAVSGALGAPVAHAATLVGAVPPVDGQATVVVVPPIDARTRPGSVVVRAGDSLWSLAESEVQPGAGPATVTARWQAIYRANRGVIGSDPDLIRPGQHLRLPS